MSGPRGKIGVRRPAIDRAKEAWGEPLPDWIAALAAKIDQAKSQSRAQTGTGYSPATISYVINKKYAGDYAKVEAAVRQSLMREVVTCPVLGEISGADCAAHQREPYTPHNPQRVALYSTCRTCPNANKSDGGKSHA